MEPIIASGMLLSRAVLRPSVPLLACAVLLCGGCDPAGYRLEVMVHAPDERALVDGAHLELQVRDRQTRSGIEVVTLGVAEDLGADRPVRLGITLHGGGAYDAHVLVDGPGGRWYATRCFSIGGTKRTEVLLAGPLDRTLDEDGDGWPTVDDCVDPDGSDCLDPCPPLRANDCNEQETDIHPSAPDACQDQIDQDCSGSDSLCSEDEAPDA